MSGAALSFVVTAYAVGCDVAPAHPTRAGTQPVAGFTIAADPRVLPIGSIIYVEGLGERMVHDTGGKVKGHHIDVFVSSCGEARAWGRRYREVVIKHRPGVGGSVSKHNHNAKARKHRRWGQNVGDVMAHGSNPAAQRFGSNKNKSSKKSKR